MTTSPGLRAAHRKMFWGFTLFNACWMGMVLAITACKKKEPTGAEAKAAVKAAEDTMTIIRKGDLCFAVLTVEGNGVGMAHIPCPADQWSSGTVAAPAP